VPHVPYVVRIEPVRNSQRGRSERACVVARSACGRSARGTARAPCLFSV
jgi:hypothetical protein